MHDARLSSAYSRARIAAALTLVLAGAIALAITLYGSSATPSKVAKGPTWHASWVHGGLTVEAMTRKVAGVAQAEVVSIEAGAPLATPGASDVEAIPTQVVTFETVKKYKGSLSDRFQLFRTGSDTQWMEGDPPYRVGESYLMFVEQRGDGKFIPFGPDGRMKIGADRRLSVESEDSPVKKQLTRPGGAELATVEAQIKGGIN